MSSDNTPILSPPQPAEPVGEPVVAPQPAVQPTFQNIYLTPKQNAPFTEGYAHKQAFVLGLAQIIIGILCVIFHLSLIGSTFVVEDFAGQGIWCGAFFILTGTFGVVSAKRKTKCLVITFMVLSILSATIFFISAFISFLNHLIMTGQGLWDYEWNEQNLTYVKMSGPEVVNARQTSYALNSILLILSVAEFVVAIWSAAVCCRGVCCRKKVDSIGPIEYTAGAYPQIIMINQQGAQTPMQVLPQGMPGQQQYMPPPMYDAGGPPTYEQNDTLPFKA